MKLLRSSQIDSKRLSARLFPLTVPTGGMAQVSAVYSPVNPITRFQTSAFFLQRLNCTGPCCRLLHATGAVHLPALLVMFSPTAPLSPSSVQAGRFSSSSPLSPHHLLNTSGLQVPSHALCPAAATAGANSQSFGPNLGFWLRPRLVLSTG